MAIAFVQQRANNPITDGATLAYNSNVGSGSLLVASILLASTSSIEVTGITDSLGNTWQRAVRKAGDTGGSANAAEIWYAHCPTGGGNTLTFDWSGANNAHVHIAEYSGFTAGVTAGPTSSAYTNNQTTCPCGEITTTVAASLLVATLSIESSFTVSSRLTGWNGLTNSIRRDSQYKIASATETTDGAVTFNDVEKTSACIAAFYPTAGGGGDDPKPWLYRSHTHTLGAGFGRGL